jgi:hypothetical protein
MDIETLFGGTMALTIGFVALSLACTCVIVAASIGLPMLYYRNQRQKAETLMATGTQGEATILALEDTGMRINDNPRVKVLLEIRLPGHPPYQLQKTVTIPLIRLSQVQVGSVMGVMVDPTQKDNPDKVGLLLR